MSLVGLFGSSAFLSSFFLISSPIPSIYEGYKKQEIKNLTVEYLLIGCVQSSLWMLYGYKLDDFYTLLTNILCVSFFLSYVNLYLWINKLNDKFLQYNAIALGSILLFALLLNGTICLLFGACFSTVWHFTMLEKMKQAIQSKDGTLINLTVAGVSLVNFFLWLMYSLLTNNYPMAVPNIVGVVMWGLNLLIFAWANNHVSEDNFIITTLAGLFKVEIKGTKRTPGEPLLNLRTSTANMTNF
jgi:uncharacterized protein with PQ loop repeat